MSFGLTDDRLTPFNECANLFEPEYVESHVQYMKELHPLNLLKIATFQRVMMNCERYCRFFQIYLL